MHLLDELGHHFRVIGVSETKITKTSLLAFNPSITGYEFEYIPTPPAAGGVGMYIKSDLNYTVIEKSFEDEFKPFGMRSSSYGSANDPQTVPQMIPGPQMIPKLYRK